MKSKPLICRILLKVSQLICSVFVVYCLYNTGPHWILTLACLLVPPFGLYLMVKSPDQKNLKTPSEKYHGLMISRSWLRVEIAICLTMGVVFFGFGILLLYGFLKLVDNVYFLLAGLGSIFVALLYSINALVTFGLLRQGTVDIALSTPARQLPCSDDPNHFTVAAISGQPNNVQTEELMVQIEELKGRLNVPHGNSNEAKSSSENVSGNQHDAGCHFEKPVFYETQQVKSVLASESSGSRSTLPIDQLPEHLAECMGRSLDNEANNNNNSNVMKPEPRKRYRYAPAGISNIQNSNTQGNLKLHQRRSSNISQISKRKVTPIPMNTMLQAQQLLDDCHRMEHFNAQFVAASSTCGQGASKNRHTEEANGYVKADACGAYESDSCVKELTRHRQRRFASKTSEQSGVTAQRRYSREESGSNHNRYDRSSDDDSTSGSFVGSLPKSTALEPQNRNIAPAQIYALSDSAYVPKCGHNYANECQKKHVNENNHLSANTEQLPVATPRPYGRRGSANSPRRYYSKQDYRRGSADIQYPSYTYTESDDEDSPSPSDYCGAVRSRHKASNSSREQGFTDPSCIPSIVTAIDSGRESEIIRNNSPWRASSRDKKMRSKGFDVMIRPQGDDERFKGRRRTRSASSSSHEKANDSFFVTEF